MTGSTKAPPLTAAQKANWRTIVWVLVMLAIAGLWAYNVYDLLHGPLVTITTMFALAGVMMAGTAVLIAAGFILDRAMTR